MKQKRHSTSVVLLVLLLSAGGTLLSCGDDAQTQKPSETTSVADDGSAVAESKEPLSFAEQHAQTKDDLPEADFGGEPFLVAINTYCESDFLMEDATGDVLDDAVYNRNKAVEERFNITLEFYNDHYSTVGAQVSKSVTAGDDAYQLLCEHTATAVSWVNGKLLYNWYDVPYVDFSNPWWSPSNTEDLTLHDTAYLAVGDYALNSIGRTYCIYYNKSKAETYQIPDLYTLVYDGDWTYDAMLSYAKDVYEDLNHNGQVDTKEDFFGYTTATSNVGFFLWTSGEKIVRDGEIVLNTEKMTDILSKLITLAWETNGVCYDPDYVNEAGNPHYIGAEKLATGTTLFASSMLSTGIDYLRDLEDDFGILPYPKWNEAQKDYCAVVDAGHAALAIPKTVSDIERAGIITEALNAESYRSVIPVYYETALKQKGTRDEESIAMIDYIMMKRVFDFGYTYDGWKGFSFVLENLVKQKNGNFASYYASNISKIEKHYNSVFELFLEED